MAKENISDLVQKLWLQYYDAENKTLKDEVQDPFIHPQFKVLVEDIIYGDFGNPESHSPNLLIQMLNLMGYPDNQASPEKSLLAKKFQGIFWFNVQCFEEILLPLLLKPKTDSAQESLKDIETMDNIFKSFESFFEHTKAHPKLAYAGQRVLDYAFQDLDPNSNHFVTRYLASEVIEKNNKRVDVAYNHLLNADNYYGAADEERLRKILDMPEKNRTLYDKIIADQEERAKRVNNWLLKTFPLLLSFLTRLSPRHWSPIKAEVVQKVQNLKAASSLGDQQHPPGGHHPNSNNPRNSSDVLSESPSSNRVEEVASNQAPSPGRNSNNHSNSSNGLNETASLIRPIEAAEGQSSSSTSFSGLDETASMLIDQQPEGAITPRERPEDLKAFATPAKIPPSTPPIKVPGSATSPLEDSIDRTASFTKERAPSPIKYGAQSLFRKSSTEEDWDFVFPVDEDPKDCDLNASSISAARPRSGSESPSLDDSGDDESLAEEPTGTRSPKGPGQ